LEIEVNHLTPEDQALLELAREGDGPSASDRAHVRSALSRRLGVAAGLAAASTITRASAMSKLVAGGTAAISAVPFAAKVVIAVAILGGVGAGGAAVYRARSAPSAAMRAPPSSVAPSTTLPPVKGPDGRSPPAGLPSSPSVLLDVQPRTVERSASSTSAGASPTRDAPARELAAPARPASAVASLAAPGPLGSAVDPQAVAPPRDATGSPPPALAATSGTIVQGDLDVETALIRAGMDALRAGDASRALMLFDEHERHFPHGVLAEERAVERILALCQLGRRADAAREGATFLEEHPASRLANHVRSSCAQNATR
jgi:hypothetical protein